MVQEGSCKNKYVRLHLGDKCKLPIKLYRNSTPLRNTDVTKMAMTLGTLTKTYETGALTNEIEYDANEVTWLFPVDEDDTTSLRLGLNPFGARIALVEDAIVSVELPPIEILPPINTEEL